MGPRLPPWLAWALALFEIVRAFALTFKYAGILIRDELDGTAPDDRRRQAAKEAAEQERKATFWDRAKADRVALHNAHKADMAARKVRLLMESVEQEESDRRCEAQIAELMARSAARMQAEILESVRVTITKDMKRRGWTDRQIETFLAENLK